MKFFPLFLVLLLPFPSLALAQGNGLPLLDDPAGDVAGVAGTYPGAASENYDLTSLEAVVDGDAILFTLALVDLDRHGVPVKDSGYYRVDFEYARVPYRVEIHRLVPVPLPDPSPLISSILMAGDGNGGYSERADLRVLADAASFAVWVPFGLVRDALGVPIASGTSIENVIASSFHDYDDPEHEPGETTVMADRMPDEGAGSYLVKFPAPPLGTLDIQLPQPTRASNGNAGAITFPIQISNRGEEEATVTLSPGALPEGWTVSLLDTALDVAPAASVQTLVFVWLPGGHVHGGSQQVEVTIDSQVLPAPVTVKLEVQFTPVPNPAGHHPVLYIHATNASQAASAASAVTGITGARAFMSTLKEDPGDSGQPVPPGPTPLGSGWLVPLSPALGLGLDFVPGREIALDLSFDVSHPYTFSDVTLYAELQLADAEERIILARGGQEAVSIGGAASFQFVLGQTAQADLQPPEPGRNLELIVTATTPDRVNGIAFPRLTGGSMRLPLLEYQDPVPDSDGQIQLTTASPVIAPPGSTVTFDVGIRSNSTEPLAVAIDLVGDLPGWGAKRSTPELNLPAEASRTIQVSLAVPQDAIDGTRLSMFVAARTGPDLPAVLLETAVVVDSTAPPPVARASDTAKTPIGLELVLGALALALHRTMGNRR